MMATERTRIEKQYGNHTGRRFAEVILADGSRRTILTRGPKDGSVANAWGEFYPFAETRTRQIIERAERPIVHLSDLLDTTGKEVITAAVESHDAQ